MKSTINDTKDVEEIDADLEAEPIEINGDLEPVNAQGALTIHKDSFEDMKWLAQHIEEIVEMKKKIMMGILKLTQEGDFTTFGNGDKIRAEIGTAACERIATIGVSLTNIKQFKKIHTDEKGSYYTYITKGTAIFRSREIPVMSIASSRDPFFGKEKGRLLEAWEISDRDVQMASWRGVTKEGVKSILGLRRMSPSELEKYGVKVSGSSYTFKSREEKADDAQKITVTITEVMTKMLPAKNKGEEDYPVFNIADSAGQKYSTFKKEFAEIAKSLKGKEALIQFTKNDKGYLNLNTIEAVPPAAAK